MGGISFSAALQGIMKDCQHHLPAVGELLVVHSAHADSVDQSLPATEVVMAGSAQISTDKARTHSSYEKNQTEQ